MACMASSLSLGQGAGAEPPTETPFRANVLGGLAAVISSYIALRS
jgi:hypothetical protein